MRSWLWRVPNKMTLFSDLETIILRLHILTSDSPGKYFIVSWFKVPGINQITPQQVWDSMRGGGRRLSSRASVVVFRKATDFWPSGWGERQPGSVPTISYGNSLISESFNSTTDIEYTFVEMHIVMCQCLHDSVFWGQRSSNCCPIFEHEQQQKHLSAKVTVPGPNGGWFKNNFPCDYSSLNCLKLCGNL